MSKKISFWAALCLLLALVMTTAAAAARLPARRGTVTDDADVLGAQTASDIAAYAETVEDESGLRLHVALVHFLDGLDAQSYADALFDAWALGDWDVLLLGAAGEDAAAAAMGAEAARLLGRQSAESLMYTSSGFSALFAGQQYDAAFNAYFRAFNALLSKQTGTQLPLEGRFGSVSEGAHVPAGGSRLWDEVMNAISQSSEQREQARADRPDNGLGAGSWIVLALLALILFGQYRSRRPGANARRDGCGCSPLGWIVSLFGLNVLIDSFRGRR